MTVYVDDPIHHFGQMIMCHMFSPDLDELFRMATTIGVKHRWFQDPNVSSKISWPHFDIAKSKRALAVKAGAVEVDRYQMVAIAQIVRNKFYGMNMDPLRRMRGPPGGENHPQLERVEAWLAEQGLIKPE